MTELHPSDANQAHALTQSREAQAHSISEVNAAHERFLAAGERASANLVEQVNEAREIGIRLIALKANAKRDFTSFFATSDGKPNRNPAFGFSDVHGRTFMRLAVALPGPINSVEEGQRSLKDVMVACGALPESSRGEQSRGGMPWFSAIERKTMSVWSDIGKQIEKKGEPDVWEVVELESMERTCLRFGALLVKIRAAKAARAVG